MKFGQTATIKIKITSLLQRIILRLENNGNSVMSTNGELNFIKNLADDYKNEKNDFVFFDIGANVGDYTQNILDNFDITKIQAHIFDPQNKCCDDLNDKFSTNKNISINELGASSESKEQTIYFDREKSSLASVYQRNLDFYNVQLDNSKTIKLIRLDEYIEKNNIKKIDLIKFDIEGHEIEALKGLGRYLNPEFIQYIQFEYGGANIDSHTNLLDFFTLLTDSGFQVCKMMKYSLEPREYTPTYENFYCQNWMAVNPKRISEYSG